MRFGFEPAAALLDAEARGDFEGTTNVQKSATVSEAKPLAYARGSAAAWEVNFRVRCGRGQQWVWVAGVVAAALSVCAFSCGSGEAVASFAEKSKGALHQGEAIYKDIPESYARGVCDRQDLTGNFKDPSPASACVASEGAQREDLEVARAERDGLIEISKVLTNYFDALQQLAAFGTSSGKKESEGGDAAKSKAETAAKQAKFDAGAAGAAGQLAQLVATAFLAARLNRELERGDSGDRPADPESDGSARANRRQRL